MCDDGAANRCDRVVGNAGGFLRSASATMPSHDEFRPLADTRQRPDAGRWPGQLCACLEVADVTSSTKDSNQKERKDLISLGVLCNSDQVAQMVAGIVWPTHRLCLISSCEFAEYLRRNGR